MRSAVAAARARRRSRPADAAELLDAEGVVAGRRGQAGRGRRPGPALGPAGPTPRAGGRSPGVPTSGSRNGEVEVHRARAATPVASATARAAERAPRARGVAASGTPGVAEPADRPAEQVGLVDGLRGADVLQLGRPVGGDTSSGTRGVVGLDHGRVELDRGRAAGGEHDRRAARRQRRGRGR